MSSRKPPWKKRKEIPDPQVQDVAEQYDDARQLLLQQPPGSGVLLPLLNAAAVAVELFLKSLCSELKYLPVAGFEGLSTVRAMPEVRRHGLIELYKQIPEDIRDQMETCFANSSLSRIKTTLQDTLAQYEGLFNTSRYPFEPTADLSKYPLMLLMELSEFLRAFVCSLEPVDRIEWS
jgi:hypothetical protein